MIFWFNHNSKKGHKEVLSISMIPLSLVKAFTGSAKYINELMIISKRQLEKAVDNNVPIYDHSEPWIDLLLQFKKNNYCSDHVTCGVDASSKAGFLAYHCDREHTQECTNEELFEKHEPLKCQCTQSHNTLKRVANVTRHMLSLSSFFLSSTNLEIQRISCDMLLNGFHLLSTVEYPSKSMGDDSDIGNPLLESVHEFWAPLRARLRSSGNGLTLVSRRQLHDTSSQPCTGRHLSILFSKVLDITATMCELSGGSMVDCFQKDVWPVIAETIHHFLQTGFTEDTQNITAMRYTGDVVCNGIHYPAPVSWEYHALLSCLECIQRVFSGQETGLLLSQLVPTVGAIVMPLLSDNGMIGDAAMDTTKALLSVDSDSLWRGLLMMSGIVFPDRPLLPLAMKNIFSCNKESETACAAKERSTQLLQYIHDLPEKSLA